MIYQFGKNLITKQKHIHLSKLEELLKMKLGKAVLDKLYRKGCWIFSPSLMGSLHQARSPSSACSSATPASILNRSVQQALDFRSTQMAGACLDIQTICHASKISLPPNLECMFLAAELHGGWEYGEAPARRLPGRAMISSPHCGPGTGG